MKGLRRFILWISFLLFIFLGFLVWGKVNPDSLFSNLWIEKQAVQSNFIEVQQLAQLNTAEYKMRLIFPYDFIEGSPDWALYKNLWDLHPEDFLEKMDPENYPNGILPDLWKDGVFYRDCRELGIDPYNFRYDFLVLSVHVKAGVELMNQGLPGQTLEMEWVQDSQQGRVLSIKMPEPEISQWIFEDLDTKAWGYPDAAISPEELRRLVEFLSPQIEARVMETGITEEARTQAMELTAFLLQGAGVDKVEFHFLSNENFDHESPSLLMEESPISE